MILLANYYTWRGRMPNYYHWEDFGLKVIVRDQNKWKSTFHMLYQYHVGDVIRLVITIERLSPSAPNFNKIIISEKTPTKGNYIPRKPGPGSANFTKIVFAVRGDVLDESGEDVWKLEVRSKDGSIDKSRNIFDAGIANRDAMRRDVILVILGFILALLGAGLMLVIEFFINY